MLLNVNGDGKIGLEVLLHPYVRGGTAKRKVHVCNVLLFVYVIYDIL